MIKYAHVMLMRLKIFLKNETQLESLKTELKIMS